MEGLEPDICIELSPILIHKLGKTQIHECILNNKRSHSGPLCNPTMRHAVCSDLSVPHNSPIPLPSCNISLPS